MVTFSFAIIFGIVLGLFAVNVGRCRHSNNKILQGLCGYCQVSLSLSCTGAFAFATILPTIAASVILFFKSTIFYEEKKSCLVSFVRTIIERK